VLFEVAELLVGNVKSLIKIAGDCTVLVTTVSDVFIEQYMISTKERSVENKLCPYKAKLNKEFFS